MTRIRTDFPYATRHEDLRVPMPDGTPLYARVWRPVTDEPVPALLEYDPCRLTDGTAARDAQRHPWYAGHGYASVRVDVRGHGNSGGLPGDAHGATGTDDGVALVHWLAEQPWCSGEVGVFGVSWGGTAALRIAARAPGPLKAVVAVNAADDPYGGALPHLDGSVLAGALPRAAALLSLACRPPDPRYAGEEWRERWLERLEGVEPLLPRWLAHPAHDEQRHGEYGAIRAAVLAVGGLHDPYRDTVLRLAEHLPPDRVRAVLGPWSVHYPDRTLPPGSAVGFLQETLRWWDHHLKGAGDGVPDEPPLRAWIGGSHPPAPVYRELPGRWVTEPSWPSPHVTPVTYGLGGGPVAVASPPWTGVDAGRLLPSGSDGDLPPDQRGEDALSACFDFTVPEDGEPVEILGRPSVSLTLRADAPTGQAVARLCDVAPDGSSTLVTRGALNLAAHIGRDRAVPARPGAWERVRFELGTAGHAFAPGHRVRLAVSSTYWPWLWPQPDGAGFALDPAGSSLTLPVRAPTRDTVEWEEPEQAGPTGVTVPGTLEEPRPERTVVRDVVKGEWRLEDDPRDGGTRVHPDGLEITEDALDTYTIEESGPLSARARSDRSVRLHRPDLGWNVTVELRAETTCDADAFHTSQEVVCAEGGEIVFHRTWERRIPRTAG
ncbi:CocE/NonD family hydrolase [Streptomyces sp. NPDC058855]|uniref:CocE/NonD family hydrolase n=1 Tax=Streptomyces sp. NPDC058855 TaxID=3346651 RepID=UPI0036A4B02B